MAVIKPLHVFLQPSHPSSTALVTHNNQEQLWELYTAAFGAPASEGTGGNAHLQPKSPLLCAGEPADASLAVSHDDARGRNKGQQGAEAERALSRLLAELRVVSMAASASAWCPNCCCMSRCTGGLLTFEPACGSALAAVIMLRHRV